jgi:uncharacterized protein (TIGR03083 family)
MTASAPPWLAGLSASSQRLCEQAEALPVQELSRPSFAAEWSIAQVLSHLGSAAEICAALVERGLAGDLSGPRREQVEPVWQRWNAMTPQEQRSQWYLADTRHLQLLRSITDEQAETLRVPYFSGPLTLAEYAGYRLSEQSLHAWDVAVALEPRAVIPADELTLLWERVDLVATRFRDDGILERLRPQHLAVHLTDTGQRYTLHLDAELHLVPGDAPSASGQVSGPADSLLRLVYGRHRPDDSVEVSGAVPLKELIALFPGY